MQNSKKHEEYGKANEKFEQLTIDASNLESKAEENILNSTNNLPEKGSKSTGNTSKDELVENAKYTEPEKPKATSQPATNTGRVKKLFLRLPDLECEQALKAKNLVEIFEGNTAVMLYNSQNKQYVAFGGADITPFLMSELKKLLGDENVVYG